MLLLLLACMKPECPPDLLRGTCALAWEDAESCNEEPPIGLDGDPYAHCYEDIYWECYSEEAERWGCP